MYFGVQQTREYAKKVLDSLDIPKNVDVFIIPDFISLASVVELVRGSDILIGAQDCFYEEKGAFTGEVSPRQLKEVGCDIVELGHAERRRIFHETDDDTAKKAAAAMNNGLIPLVCIGEKTKGALDIAVAECRAQVDPLLEAIPKGPELVLAYEPVWAIGQSKSASADHIVDVCKALRSMTENRSGPTRILYGGSAGPGLFEELSGACDGLFLGRFAHDPEQLLKIVQEISAAPPAS